MSRYTNAVLTVIAVALVALVVENAVSQARAQSTSTIMRVAICDPKNVNECAHVSMPYIDSNGVLFVKGN
ncbi:hypothetical protein [Paraburkholderia hospita]|uniref:hypothetical protein n=1 Tax=Paraburkholderia hospita TaxID=169430 RepID=UPI000F0A61AD|nr:hypothetical protein [Paraburkholderia hospita]